MHCRTTEAIIVTWCTEKCQQMADPERCLLPAHCFLQLWTVAICMQCVRWTLHLGYLCMVTISAVPSLWALCTLYVSVWSFILDPRSHVR